MAYIYFFSGTASLHHQCCHHHRHYCKLSQLCLIDILLHSWILSCNLFPTLVCGHWLSRSALSCPFVRLCLLCKEGRDEEWSKAGPWWAMFTHWMWPWCPLGPTRFFWPIELLFVCFCCFQFEVFEIIQLLFCTVMSPVWNWGEDTKATGVEFEKRVGWRKLKLTLTHLHLNMQPNRFLVQCYRYCLL